MVEDGQIITRIMKLPMEMTQTSSLALSEMCARKPKGLRMWPKNMKKYVSASASVHGGGRGAGVVCRAYDKLGDNKEGSACVPPEHPVSPSSLSLRDCWLCVDFSRRKCRIYFLSSRIPDFFFVTLPLPPSLPPPSPPLSLIRLLALYFSFSWTKSKQTDCRKMEMKP